MLFWVTDIALADERIAVVHRVEVKQASLYLVDDK